MVCAAISDWWKPVASWKIFAFSTVKKVPMVIPAMMISVAKTALVDLNLRNGTLRMMQHPMQ